MQQLVKQQLTPAQRSLAIVAGLSLLLAGCGRGEFDTCTLLELEDAEVEVDIGDADIERAEVEMVCDGVVLDVTWPEFRRKLNIDPGQFRGNVNALAQAVSCGRYERENKDQVWCQTPAMSQPVALKFTFDD